MVPAKVEGQRSKVDGWNKGPVRARAKVAKMATMPYLVHASRKNRSQPLLDTKKLGPN